MCPPAREEADFVAAYVLGVVDVFDEITLKARPQAKAIEEEIKSAFKRNAALDADDLSVTTSSGTVKLERRRELLGRAR
ncbi:MAG TPA: BON domain-containing protein [Solirubrobacteraceae bacterium]|nr:BON domain-containing protein [Solirubrobacteraceae bacterium]